jgi:hypothetical protein
LSIIILTLQVPFAKDGFILWFRKPNLPVG